jgi:biotin carboxyl carrier protein
MEIGFVEMLGIHHEVRASGDGVVRHLVAESGEPVEYGQLLVEIDRAGSA